MLSLLNYFHIGGASFIRYFSLSSLQKQGDFGVRELNHILSALYLIFRNNKHSESETWGRLIDCESKWIDLQLVFQ